MAHAFVTEADDARAKEEGIDLAAECHDLTTGPGDDEPDVDESNVYNFKCACLNTPFASK